MQEIGLNRLFKPESVVLYGASGTPGTLGSVILANLKVAGFGGPITLVNPKYPEIDGQRCYPKLAEAGCGADVAIVAAPASFG